MGGVHLSLNNSLCLSLPLSQSPSDFPPAIPLFLTLLVALSPLRVGDILGLIPRENCFHLLRCALELSGLLQAFTHSGGDLLSERCSVVHCVYCSFHKQGHIQAHPFYLTECPIIIRNDWLCAV